MSALALRVAIKLAHGLGVAETAAALGVSPWVVEAVVRAHKLTVWAAETPPKLTPAPAQPASSPRSEPPSTEETPAPVEAAGDPQGSPLSRPSAASSPGEGERGEASSPAPPPARARAAPAATDRSLSPEDAAIRRLLDSCGRRERLRPPNPERAMR